MPESIEVDDDVFSLLKSHAEPFVDTPNSVLRRLLGVDRNGSVRRMERPRSALAASSPSRSRAERAGKKSSRAGRGTLLPESEYELPILRYLDQHDGRAPSREVIDAIGEELAERLTEADKQPLNSGEIRWKSRAAFVRLRLVERQELDANAPRGTWQITDMGRQRVRSEM